MKRFMAKKITQEEFLSGVTAIHGNNIDFSKSVYINDVTKVMCKCKKCGNIWWATPNNLKHGKGCPNCNHKSRKYTLDEWFEMAKKAHNNRYDLSLVDDYHSRTQKMKIICHDTFSNGEEHGVFDISSNSFLHGRGCPYCAINTIKEKQKKPLTNFILESKKIHGNKYDYSKVKYINANTKVCIVCAKHGEFWQTPHKHINGKHGCPICNESKLENEVAQFLSRKNIEYKQGHHFEWLGLQHLDFYLPKYDIAIECQGGQHYDIAKFGGVEDKDILEKNFKQQQERDSRKKKLCEENGIKLLYFTHYRNVKEDEITFKNKEKLLEHITNE